MIGVETLVPTVLIAVLVVVPLAVVYRFVRGALEQSILRHRLDAHERALLAGEVGLLATVGMFLFVLLALGVILVWRYADLAAGQFRRAIVAVLFAALIAAFVGSVTRRFVYLAITAFMLVGIVVGVFAYWCAANEEQVRGAAIWRQDGRAVYGIFVAEGAAARVPGAVPEASGRQGRHEELAPRRDR